MIVLQVLLFLLPNSQSFADPLICHDPVKAICESDILKQAGKSPRKSKDEIVQIAVEQMNAFLGKEQKPEEFLKNLEADLREGPSSADHRVLSRAIINGLAYAHCTEYLTRAFYSQRILDRQCFTKPLDKSVPLTISTLATYFSSLPPEDETEKLFNTVKNGINTALKSLNYSASLTEFLSAELEGTQRITFAQFLLWQLPKIKLTDLTKTPSLYFDLFNTCDLNLTEKNAFNYPGSVARLKSGIKVRGAGLVVCPSVWMSALNETSEGDESSNITILSHEIGHTLAREISEFDDGDSVAPWLASEGKSVYQNILSCMETRYIKKGSLSLRYPDFKTAADKRAFFNQFDFKPETLTAQIYYQEHVADLIATLTTARYLEQFATQKKRIELTVRNLSINCGSKMALLQHDPFTGVLAANATQLHPSGKFRVEAMILDDEGIRAELGCTTPARPSTCKSL